MISGNVCEAYNFDMNLSTISLFAAVSMSASAQLVSVGPPGETREHYCAKVEKLKPNLVLSSTTRLSGQIIDGSGAPFKNSVVELRIYISELQQTSFKKVITDEDGNFDFANVERGSYRLLASPTRLFEQPGKLECQASEKCSLKITLRVHPTDMPDSFCPVR